MYRIHGSPLLWPPDYEATTEAIFLMQQTATDCVSHNTIQEDLCHVQNPRVPLLWPPDYEATNPPPPPPPIINFVLLTPLW